MKPKHTNCVNCGASSYKPISTYEIECEYCGTVYGKSGIISKDDPISKFGKVMVYNYDFNFLGLINSELLNKAKSRFFSKRIMAVEILTGP